MKQSIITLENIVKIAALALVLSVGMSSCKSLKHTFSSGIPKETPSMDLSDSEIIQLAQNAYDQNNTKLAEYYYKLLLQRYGNNPLDYIEGRFELGHIAIKKKDYVHAVPMLQEIIDIYNNAPAGALPGAYRKLAENDLAKVPAEKLAEIKAQQNADALKQEEYSAGSDDDSSGDETYDDEEYDDEDYSDDEAYEDEE